MPLLQLPLLLLLLHCDHAESGRGSHVLAGGSHSVLESSCSHGLGSAAAVALQMVMLLLQMLGCGKEDVDLCLQDCCQEGREAGVGRVQQQGKAPLSIVMLPLLLLPLLAEAQVHLCQCGPSGRAGTAYERNAAP